jgi:hypothetical protein
MENQACMKILRAHGTKSRSLPPYFSRYQTSPGIYIILVRALGRHPILSCFLDRNRPVVTSSCPTHRPARIGALALGFPTTAAVTDSTRGTMSPRQRDPNLSLPLFEALLRFLSNFISLSF